MKKEIAAIHCDDGGFDPAFQSSQPRLLKMVYFAEFLKMGHRTMARQRKISLLSIAALLLCAPSACRDDVNPKKPEQKEAPKSKANAGEAVAAAPIGTGKEKAAKSPESNDPLEAAPFADLGIPPAADPSLAALSSERQKVAALNYSREWQRSREVFVRRWDKADYAVLNTREECAALVSRMPRTDSAKLTSTQMDRILEAVTAVVAMNSCTGYEEYVSFAKPRHAALKPDRLKFILERQSRDAGQPLGENEAVRRIWQKINFVDGAGPWYALSVDHSEIATRKSDSANISLREEILAIGTPSTAFSFSSCLHTYPRTPADELKQRDEVLVATVRLLLRGREPDQFGPMLLRFWWDSSTQLWLLDDEIMFLRNEGNVSMPWF